MELNERLRQKVAAYKPTPLSLKAIRRAPILLLAGISGAGKDTAKEHLLASYPGRYAKIVTHTTRPLRPYEKNGVHYYFIDFAAAEKLLDAGGYIESNIVHSNDIYGTTIAEVKRIYDQGKVAVADVTIQGCDDYVRLGLNAKAVFLLPPSYAVWKKRFGSRNDAIEKDELKRRLQSAIFEINHAVTTPHFYIVINDKLEETVELANSIACDEPVEPHYPKAVKIAEELIASFKAELSTLDA